MGKWVVISVNKWGLLATPSCGHPSRGGELTSYFCEYVLIGGGLATPSCGHPSKGGELTSYLCGHAPNRGELTSYFC